MQHLRNACFILFSILFWAACGTQKTYLATNKPDDAQLYRAILAQDSAFFEAYNTCHLDQKLIEYAAFYSDSLEFYHDKGGVMTSKAAVVAGTKKNVCGKVTRELIKGSVEVYPIANFGAIEIGWHKFHNNTEKPDTPSNAGRFVIVWQNKNNQWKITRVISLH
jgi:hypothetical protein